MWYPIVLLTLAALFRVVHAFKVCIGLFMDCSTTVITCQHFTCGDKCCSLEEYILFYNIIQKDSPKQIDVFSTILLYMFYVIPVVAVCGILITAVLLCCTRDPHRDNGQEQSKSPAVNAKPTKSMNPVNRSSTTPPWRDTSSGSENELKTAPSWKNITTRRDASYEYAQAQDERFHGYGRSEDGIGRPQVNARRYQARTQTRSPARFEDSAF